MRTVWAQSRAPSLCARFAWDLQDHTMTDLASGSPGRPQTHTLSACRAPDRNACTYLAITAQLEPVFHKRYESPVGRPFDQDLPPALRT